MTEPQKANRKQQVDGSRQALEGMKRRREQMLSELATCRQVLDRARDLEKAGELRLLEHDRRVLDLARQEHARCVATLAQRKRELTKLRRNYRAEHSLVAKAQTEFERARKTLEAIEDEIKVAQETIYIDLEAYLTDDIAKDVAALAGNIPIVMLPVRLETRFVRYRRGLDIHGELWVRIYPDAILAESHEPDLSESEFAAGCSYWQSDDKSDAWAALVAQVGAPRAAWIVKRTNPATCEQENRVLRSANWQRVPEARLLPDRWLVRAYCKDIDDVIEKVSKPIKAPRALTSILSDDGEDGAAKWITEFEEAKNVGMAVCIHLTEDQYASGFKRILVLGVKTSMSWKDSAERLAALLENHHYTRGLAFVPQGTPTNNLSGEPSGYPPPDPHGSTSFAVECKGLEVEGPGAESFDGARFMDALGLPRDLARHIAGGDGHEQQNAWAMARALWPATIGYFLEQMMSPSSNEMPPLLSEEEKDEIERVREHFSGYVRGRGPLPAFRVGDIPYGLLPVSFLPDDASFGGKDPFRLLSWLREHWLSCVDNVPCIFRTGDPDEDLLTTLGTDASTREVRTRSVLGRDTQRNMMLFFGYDQEQEKDKWDRWWKGEEGEEGDEEKIRGVRWYAQKALDALGQHEWNPSVEPITIEEHENFEQIEEETLRSIPRIVWMSFADEAYLFRHNLVTDEPLSETEGLQSNYIEKLLDYSSYPLHDMMDLLHRLDERSLLFLMLWHAYLTEYVRAAREVLHKFGEINISDEKFQALHHEAELLGIFQDLPTIWDLLFDRYFEDILSVLITGLEVVESGSAPDEEIPKPWYEFLYALLTLKDLPTAELERLFTETLDVCSHRLDAWITSLATKRLQEMRQSQETFEGPPPFPSGHNAESEFAIAGEQPRYRGSYIGAYGWVENLVPDESNSDSDGFIYCPSMAHGAAAAVLRNAFRTRSGKQQQAYAINLSSARVRMALRLLDTIREGQPLGAALGYQFERGLHEGHSDAELDQYIDDFRRSYPMVAHKANQQAESDESVESVAARNVVDGLALRRAWQNNGILWEELGLGLTGDEETNAKRMAIQTELHKLDDAVDAVTDLLTAESVFQTTRGSMGSAGATLDSMAKGVRPPEPEIIRTPRGGTSLFHRVGLLLGDPPEQSVKWGSSEPHTPRGRAEPYLNAWVGRMLGDPSQVKCCVRISVPEDQGDQSPEEITVTLDDLGLEPLDVLALALEGEDDLQESEPNENIAYRADSELNRRIIHFAASKSPGAELDIQDICFNPPNLGPQERTFPQILEIARAINAVLSIARPLRPQDLVLPEEASSAQSAEFHYEELIDRVDAVVNELKGIAHRIFNSANQVLGINVGELRKALCESSLLGISAAFPSEHKGSSSAASRALVVQAKSVLRQLAKRLDSSDEIVMELRELLPSIANCEQADDLETDSLRALASALGIEEHHHISLLSTIAGKLHDCLNQIPNADFRDTLCAELRVALATQAQSMIKAVFGRSFVVVPRFKPPNYDELKQAKLDIDPDESSVWVSQVARVRKPLGLWRGLRLYANTVDGACMEAVEIIQLPHEEDARWVALDFPNKHPPSGCVSLVFHRLNSTTLSDDADEPWVGLMLDEWPELAPHAEEDAGLAFHYDSPGAQAPQAVLVAVPPEPTEHWDLEDLVRILNETLDLTKIRAVDGDLLGEYGQILPMIYLAANADNDTVSTSFVNFQKKEPEIVKQED